MSVSELVRDKMVTSLGLFERLMEGLAEKPLATASEKGGNSVIWTVGHLCTVEGGVYSLVTGEANEVAKWDPMFGKDSTPRADGAGYPAVEELVTTWRQLRERNLKLVEKLGEAGMAKAPVYVPPGFEALMKTTGHALMAVSWHQMMHMGQLADIRRQLGLKRYS